MSSGAIRRRLWVLAALAVVLCVAAAWLLLTPRALSFAAGDAVSIGNYRGPSPTGVPSELASGDVVARGRYLTQAADCQVCHTREGGPPFGGGRVFKTPFGMLYSPNLTPDRETGIGAWSDTDFLRAVHEGIAKDGQRLYPAFPYESYTLLADEDVLAIKAYLFSLPPVHATIPANTLKFPFNQRWLMGIWAALYSPAKRFEPHSNHSPEWNRGAYLVEALAHCGDCHTPRNLGQAPNNRRKFAGALTAGWRAYNITADRASGIGSWSDEELTEYLRSGHVIGHGSAGGPMAEEVEASSSMMTPSDLHAVVTYLRSIPAIATPEFPAVKTVAASESPKLQAAVDRHGEAIFAGACASCHSWSGQSLITSAATLTGDRTVNDPQATNVAQIVLLGSTPSGDAVAMPAFGEAYTNEEIAAVANFVTNRFGAVQSKLGARDVERLRQLTSR
jgi:mono/diheme cytochrome c family protein